MKAKITVRSVEGIQPEAKDVILWDTDVTGFGCKVTPAGKRTYLFQFRSRDGRAGKLKIGDHGPIRPEAARALARMYAGEVALGRDPSLSRAKDRSAPTVSDLASRYMVEHARTRKKASSIRNDLRLISRHIEPCLGRKKVAAVTRADIAALHHSLHTTPYEANRCLALASKMFALAERWGMRPDGTNPAKNIDRYREEQRARYLSNEEFRRLWNLLDSEVGIASVSISAIAAIKLLMLTGRRLTEVLELRWEWIDMQERTLNLPDSKNGALLVSLGAEPLSILRELKLRGLDDVYVIAGQRKNSHLKNLQKPWRKLRALAGLDDVRIHDLRHTFASVGAGLGMSLPLIGALLGHTQAATTQRYAHLAQAPVRVAADQIGAEMLSWADVPG